MMAGMTIIADIQRRLGLRLERRTALVYEWLIDRGE
jgi:hypothetical protein